MVEIWKQIPDFSDRYEVSNLGRVRSWIGHNGRYIRKIPLILKTKRSGKYVTYERVNLCKENGIVITCAVHLLVLETFVGERPAVEYEARHLNGVSNDNTLTNLCWGTKLENADDRKRHGTNSAGEKNPHAKLTRELVDEILIKISIGISYDQIMSEYGISRGHVSRIKNGDAWVAI